MLIGLFVLPIICSAQANKQLKGPEAKNYKPWQKKKNKTATKTVVHLDRASLKGPKAKNAKPWQNKQVVQPIEILATRKVFMKGPKAKNSKPWQKDAKYYSDSKMVQMNKSEKKVVVN